MYSIRTKETRVMSYNARNQGGQKSGRHYLQAGPGRPQNMSIADFINIPFIDQQKDIYKKRNGGAPIDKLNEDCLLHVFSFLSIVERVKVQRVSKRWQHTSLLSLQSVRRMNLIEADWGLSIKSNVVVDRDAFNQVINMCGPFLTHFDLTKDIIGRTPKLRIVSCKASLMLIKDACPKLKSLGIGRPTTASAIDYVASEFPKVNQLTMEIPTFDYSYQTSLANLFLERAGLTYLNMKDSKISTKCVEEAIFPRLKELHLHSCEFEGVKTILTLIKQLPKGCHTLSLLYCYTTNGWESPALKAIGDLTQLKKLNVALFGKYRASVDTNFIRNLTNLEELSLHGCDMANDETLRKISRECKKIRKLQITSSHLITDEGISQLANLPHLEYLQLESLESLECKNLEVLSQIKHLQFNDCSYLKNEGLINLIAHSKNIECIKIIKCALINEEFIAITKSVASETLKVIFDNSSITNKLAENMHSLIKYKNQIFKKFKKTCINCYYDKEGLCTGCHYKEQIC